MPENNNEALVSQMTEMLDTSRSKLESIEKEYQQLRGNGSGSDNSDRLTTRV